MPEAGGAGAAAEFGAREGEVGEYSRVLGVVPETSGAEREGGGAPDSSGSGVGSRRVLSRLA